MILDATLESVNDGRVFDISELLADITWETELESSFPGKLGFTLMKDDQFNLVNGDRITLKVDSQNVFKGVVRQYTTTESKKYSVSAYDSKYILKSKDTIVFPAYTASSRFLVIMEAANIPYKLSYSPQHVCAPYIADAKSYHEMMQDAIDETKKASKERCAIMDDFGQLEFFNIDDKVTNYILGDESLVTSYDYEASIEEAFNSIKVAKENSETKQREIALAKDDAAIKRWGLLQDVVSPEESEGNQAQMQEQANNLLNEHDREKQTLKLEAVGMLGIKAGNTIRLQIDKLKEFGLYDKNFLITKCSHKFSKSHTMSLDVEAV